MNMHMKTNIATRRGRTTFAACVVAFALAACGGGGNSSGQGDNGNAAAPANATTGFAGQDAAAPVITNNVALDGRNWLNYRRAQVGMAALADNKAIDTAAQGHSDYQRTNNTVTHVQESGKQGFTGAQLQDRFRAAGYVFNGSNAIGEVISATTNGSGFYMAEELITAIYHRFVIFEPVFKEIGTGSASTAANYVYFTADMAANNGLGAGLGAGALAVWPFNNQTQVQPNFFSDNEEPDPVPATGVNEVGYPISVHANMTVPIVVQGFTVRARGAGSDLPVYAVNNQVNSADAGQRHVLSAAAIIPKAPLASNTTYDVSFSGTVGGAPVSKTWSFTTR
jgi:uncharacterized protein YkwD